MRLVVRVRVAVANPILASIIRLILRVVSRWTGEFFKAEAKGRCQP